MKFFFGLGNPGSIYTGTRHNIGFDFIDYLASKISETQIRNDFNSIIISYTNTKGEKIYLIKPQTYMNLSGNAVSEIKQFYKPDVQDIFIVFDDLDIEECKFKIQKGKYPKSHNGIKDIIAKCKTDQFNFIRIGIDGRSNIEKQFISGKDYVLSKYNKEIFTRTFNDIINALKEIMI